MYVCVCEKGREGEIEQSQKEGAGAQHVVFIFILGKHSSSYWHKKVSD
jgi:hypothetical protein